MAKKIEEVKASTSEISQEFNLKRVFGLKDSQDFPGNVAVAIGQEMIDRIRERTLKGKGKDGKDFAPPGDKYSQAYKESLTFKAFKGSKRKPDLKLTGGMLESIDILETDPENFKIGIDDPSQTPKAFNHQTGDTPGMPKREFFGMSDDDIEAIRAEFQSDVDAQIGTPQTQSAADILETLSALEDRAATTTVGARQATSVGDIFAAAFTDPEFF